MQIRPTAFTIGLIIHSFITLFFVYTEFGIGSRRASDCKYSYQGNLNLMIGYFKYRIPMMILSPHLIISTAKILIRLCMRQPVPIISDRSFPRPEFSHQRKVFCPKYAI